MLKKQRCHPKRSAYFLAGALLAAAGFAAGNFFLASASTDGGPPVSPQGSRTRPARRLATTDPLIKGKALYGQYCMKCHGPGARGSEKGPSFISRIYHPKIHSDIAFFLAAKRGVRAHHWSFGKMPPVPGPTDKDISQIVRYVRDLQKKAGVY